MGNHSDSGTVEQKELQRYQVTPDAFCVDARSLKDIEPYRLNRVQCQQQCDATEGCVGIEMECTAKCKLLSKCNETQGGSCGSYVAVKKSQSASVRRSFELLYSRAANHLTVALITTVTAILYGAA